MKVKFGLHLRDKILKLKKWTKFNQNKKIQGLN